jgi:hypothetical protein
MMPEYLAYESSMLKQAIGKSKTGLGDYCLINN